jgi:hypothetical protein
MLAAGVSRAQSRGKARASFVLDLVGVFLSAVVRMHRAGWHHRSHGERFSKGDYLERCITRSSLMPAG